MCGEKSTNKFWFENVQREINTDKFPVFRDSSPEAKSFFFLFWKLIIEFGRKKVESRAEIHQSQEDTLCKDSSWNNKFLALQVLQ